MDGGERLGSGPSSGELERIQGLEAELNFFKEQLSSYEASSARSRRGDGGSTYRSNGPGVGSSRPPSSAASSSSTLGSSRLNRGTQPQIRHTASKRASARSSAQAAEAAIDAVRRSQPPAPYYHDELGNKVHVQTISFTPPAPAESSSDRAVAPGRAAKDFRAVDPATEREAMFRHQQERVRSTSKARAIAVGRCEDPDRPRDGYFSNLSRGSPMGVDLHKKPPPLMSPANQYYATPVYESHLVEDDPTASPSEASPKHTARSGYSQCSSHFAHHTRSESPNNHVFPPALLLARQASPRSRSRGGYSAVEASECTKATTYTACTSYSPASYRHLPKRLARGRIGGKQKRAPESAGSGRRPLWYQQGRYKGGEGGGGDSPRGEGGPPLEQADTLNPTSSSASSSSSY